MKGEKREKVACVEVTKNGLTVRIEIKVRGAGRRSSWTAADTQDIANGLSESIHRDLLAESHIFNANKPFPFAAAPTPDPNAPTPEGDPK